MPVTDIVELAQRLHRRIKWQEIPEEMNSEDMVDIICDAIRMLYVISGRSLVFSEDMFTSNPPVENEATDESVEDEGQEQSEETDEEEETPAQSGLWFTETMMLDEIEWVLLEGEIAFYNMVLSNVDDLQSYTTDAMSVTHGDKPYKNVKSTVEDRQNKQAVVWTRMVRFNQLGVSG